MLNLSNNRIHNTAKPVVNQRHQTDAECLKRSTELCSWTPAFSGPKNDLDVSEDILMFTDDSTLLAKNKDLEELMREAEEAFGEDGWSSRRTSYSQG